MGPKKEQCQDCYGWFDEDELEYAPGFSWKVCDSCGSNYVDDDEEDE